MAQRTCDVDGCGKAHRARGLCMAHWNLTHGNREKRYPVESVPCGYCGVACLKRKDKTRPLRFCSYLCRDLWRIETGTNPRPSDEAMRRARGAPRQVRDPMSCPIPADHPARWYGDSSALEYRACVWCGQTYPCRAGHKTRIYCTDRCKDKARRCRRRGSESVAGIGVWTWADFMRVARRFHYCCAYCGTKPDRLDADHVLALSRGGQNVLNNLLPACLMCNSDKRDLTLPEWDEDRRRRGLPPRCTNWGPEDSRYHHLTLGTAAAA